MVSTERVLNHHSLALQAWRGLYDREPDQLLDVRYSAKFKGYNASIYRDSHRIVFRLSRRFADASDEIQIGIMQHLLNKSLKTKKGTMEIELYNKFLKNMTEYAKVTVVDPFLKQRFMKVNEKYFNGFMTVPNLAWGTHSLSKLGHYEFGTDTIIVSAALKEDEELLDYVLYHEMLHKKHKFNELPGGFTRSHTKQFRADEKRFTLADGSDPEKWLAAFLRKKRREQRGSLAFGLRPRSDSKKRLFRTLFNHF